MLLVAAANSAAVVILGVVVSWADGKSPLFLVLQRTAVLFGVIVPFSLLIGLWTWRDVRRFARGDRRLRRAALEAFLLGFLPRPLSDTVGIVRDAVAAGPSWPTPGYSSVGQWLSYGSEVVGVAFVIGTVAALLGTLLALANRTLYEKLANLELQTAGASRRR